MVLSPFSWVAESTHRQLKANSLFPSAKRIWTPLSGARSSHHIMGRAAQPAQKLSSNSEVHRDAMREALPPLPSLPRALHCDEATVTRDARSLQERHRPERLRLRWGELLSASPAISLQVHTQRGTLSSRLRSQAVVFPNKWNETHRKGWRKSSCFQKQGLELRSPTSLRQVTEMVLQPGDTGPHQEVGTPRSGSCFSKYPRRWFKTESLSRRDYNT